MKKLREKNGITLIVLVITIIVLLILAGVTVTTLVGENGIIAKANNAKLATELAQYKEDLELYKIEKTSENPNFLESSLTAGKNNLFYNTQKTGETGNIETVLPSLDNKHREILEVIKGEILINTKDKDLIEVAQSLGIAVNPYDIVDGELLSSNGNLLLMDENGTVTIPDSVTKIGEGAFANLDGLKTIIIPGTVKEIGKNAFRKNITLENVIIQEGVERIGEGAFLQCDKLKSIKLPESLTIIDKKAFYYCMNLASIQIPSKITQILSETFCGCYSLSHVTFKGNEVDLLGMDAFRYTAINTIDITDKVSNISPTAFAECSNLENIIISSKNNNFIYEEGILITSNKENVIFVSSRYFSKSTEFTIPSGIKNFNTDISKLVNVKKLNIPSSIEQITAEWIPASIVEVIIDADNQTYKTYENCIYSKINNDLIYCYSKEKEITLSSTPTVIKTSAFSGAINAEKIVVPDSVLRIEKSAFSRCNKLQELSLGKSVQDISPMFKYKNYAGNVIIDSQNQNFTIENNILYSRYKEKLINVLYEIQGTFTLDSKVKEIGDNAFYGQSSLSGVQLTNNLEKIGNAFMFCKNLISIEIPSRVESIGDSAFEGSNNLKEVKINKAKDSISGAPWGCVTGDRAIIWKQ